MIRVQLETLPAGGAGAAAGSGTEERLRDGGVVARVGVPATAYDAGAAAGSVSGGGRVSRGIGRERGEGTGEETDCVKEAFMPPPPPELSPEAGASAILLAGFPPAFPVGVLPATLLLDAPGACPAAT